MRTKLRVDRDVFIQKIYNIHLALVDLYDKGVETDQFKIWRMNDNYYILDKYDGVLISWYKLLGWCLSCNIRIGEHKLNSLLACLKYDLESANILPGEEQ